MKTRPLQLATAILLTLTLNAAATTRYVDLNSPSPTPPYTDWPTAATNIQDAIDAAIAGDSVVVSNGVCNTGTRLVSSVTTSNRVAVTLPITLQSVNGPEVTVIEGYRVPGSTNGASAVRCVFMTNGSALVGFTLTNGATVTTGYGGGVWFQTVSHTTSLLTNCFLIGNAADYGGGGAYGGGVLVDCTLSDNTAHLYGGGVYGCILTNCILQGNSANSGRASEEGNLNDCLLTGNSARTGGADNAGKLRNCTVTGNSAGFSGGGVQNNGTLENCIVYFNNAPLGPNYRDSLFHNCCTTPPQDVAFSNCVTNEPSFVNPAGGDFRLQSISGCINAGYNAAANTQFDLAGNPRIAGGTVDIGAYEFQSPASILSYAWLQQYDLPTDGSADFADPDGDGMNNYGEWRSDTIPTNAVSVLQMVSATNSLPGAMVTWQSVATRSYWLERATNLGVATAFQTVATNVVGLPGTKTFTDTSATNGGPYFYRVGVQ